MGAVKLILGGFLFYDLFGLLFSVAAIPLLTLLYDGINSENRAAPRYKAALAGFVLSAVFALGNYTVFGFSLSAVAAFCITMYAAKEELFASAEAKYRSAITIGREPVTRASLIFAKVSKDGVERY